MADQNIRRTTATLQEKRYSLALSLWVRYGYWGSCSSCPRGLDQVRSPEHCVNRERYDHKIESRPRLIIFGLKE